MTIPIRLLSLALEITKLQSISRLKGDINVCIKYMATLLLMINNGTYSKHVLNVKKLLFMLSSGGYLCLF